MRNCPFGGSAGTPSVAPDNRGTTSPVLAGEAAGHKPDHRDLDEGGGQVSGLELVAEAADGNDVAGRGRFRLDLRAQPLDVDVQRLGVPDVVGAPDAVDEL